MGRVFDAIKKSSTADENATQSSSADNERNDESARPIPVLPSAREIEEQIFAGSTIAHVSSEQTRVSASSAHTAKVSDGTALTRGIASRAAGATLDAAGATRSEGFKSYNVS